ncbi:hypothetical protein DFQ10_105280 [Winogradskyella eximia]|uniref:Uncharacterized protein n=1 Tax=Winogradskyella eximia TaxID=262006 RepID=A0A3D9H2H0_9FLAO|nr:hypothetical protein DFQ10_105280 [Winogradskyella eximia]
MSGLLATYYLMTLIIDIKLIHIVWVPMIVILYPTYFITIVKNRYLIITKKNKNLLHNSLKLITYSLTTYEHYCGIFYL